MMMSLQHLEASALVQLLTDSIAHKHNTCELQSLHLALDVCLQSVKIIQELMQECQSNNKEVKEANRSLLLASLNTDTLLEICSYADIKSKVKLRFTASSVHKAMMRCPLDFSKTDSDYIHVDTIPVLTNYFPIRYWKCLNTKTRSYCDQEALCPINMLDINKSELHLRHFAHCGDDDVASHKSTTLLSLSKLSLLGFDRSWTITGATIFEQDMDEYESLFSSMVRYNAHHSFKSICFDTNGVSVTDILAQHTEESVMKGIEEVKICMRLTTGDLPVVDDFSVFERFSSLRSLKFHHTNITSIKDDFLNLSCLTNLERFVTRDCENDNPKQNLDFLKPLTKLNHLVLGVTSKLGWTNASSISCLNQLTHFELKKGANDLSLSHLSCLTMLEVLDASYMESLIEGNIESLSKLRKLKKLSLAGQCVHGNISVLIDMTNLTSLIFNNCSVMGDISSLSKLRKLSRLSLSSPLSGDIEVMSNFIKLESCFLGHLSVHGDIAVLSHLTATTNLVIQHCSKIEGDISCLSKLTKLKELKLMHCPGIKGSWSSISGIIEHLTCFFNKGLSGVKQH
jgi:hypothetical protein